MKRVAGGTSFMKMMIYDYAEQLEFPPAFIKHRERCADGKFAMSMGRCEEGEYQVRVWGSGGHHCWIVEAEKDGDGLFFRNGWPEFVEDNHVGFADVLVFIYEGRNKFLIKIFDPSGIKRNMASIIPKKEEDVGVDAQDAGDGEDDKELMGMNPEPDDGNEEGDDEDKLISMDPDPNDGNEEGDDELMDAEFDKRTIYYVSGNGECHLEVGGKLEKEMQGSLEPNWVERLRHVKVEGEKEEYGCAEPHQKESMDLFDMNGESEKDRVGPSWKESSSRIEEEKESSSRVEEEKKSSPRIAEEKESIKESSVLPPFNSSNTHFSATWSPTWQHYLTIPKEIAIEKDLFTKSQLLIRDLRGRIWFMKLSKADGTINLTEKWSKFCKCFGLAEGDTCTLEFTSSRIVNVHISTSKSSLHTGQ